MRITYVFLALSIVSFVLVGAGPLAPANLRVNHLIDPIVDTPVPRFSWLPQHTNRSVIQSAYTIQVVQAPSGKVVWSSGKVISDSLSAVYPSSATPLVSDSLYNWNVAWFDQDGVISKSTAGTFGTALLKASDWEGQWIGGDEYGGGTYNLYQDNLLRKEFTITKRLSTTWARAYISGLGYYELYINAQRVGDYKLDPGWPTYLKTVYYSAFDVSQYLTTGENVIVVLLGHGWYASNGVREPNGLLSLMFQMNVKYSDGSSAHIVSDLTWHGVPSPISFDSIYDGETYDATLENPSYYLPNVTYTLPWELVQPVAPPGGALVLMPMEHVRFQQFIYPITITQLPNSTVYVYDMGQEFRCTKKNTHLNW
jgi:alpha-L-rhamnosidase